MTDTRTYRTSVEWTATNAASPRDAALAAWNQIHLADGLIIAVTDHNGVTLQIDLISDDTAERGHDWRDGESTPSRARTAPILSRWARTCWRWATSRSAAPVRDGDCPAVQPATLTYLDHPDHRWELDPGASNDADVVLTELLDRDDLTLEALTLILRGAHGLHQRRAGTPAQCLDTAMIWYFG